MGIDNLNDYYDVERKTENLEELNKYHNLRSFAQPSPQSKVIHVVLASPARKVVYFA